MFLFLVVTSGCWGTRHPTKRIEGTVTFRGAVPPKEGEIFFAPVSVRDGYPKRSAVGVFDVQGKFRVTSFVPDDGLVPGTYKVTIQCWREPPTLENKLRANYVPSDYSPEVVISTDADEPVPVAIDVPRLQ